LNFSSEFYSRQLDIATFIRPEKWVPNRLSPSELDNQA
jgi:hypothetical protein